MSGLTVSSKNYTLCNIKLGIGDDAFNLETVDENAYWARYIK